MESKNGADGFKSMTLMLDGSYTYTLDKNNAAEEDLFGNNSGDVDSYNNKLTGPMRSRF